MRSSLCFTLFVLGLFLLGCRKPEVERGIVWGSSHDRYEEALAAANLSETALGREWIQASKVALGRPRYVTLPHREVVYFDPTTPEALGLTFGLEQGQQLRVRVTAPEADTSNLFLDLYLFPEFRPLQFVASADSTRELVVNVRQTQAYLLRIQPELLRGGRYTIHLEVGGSLHFPVAGEGNDAIRSFFGDPRDGGMRDHHGVDIFAPKGTPVLAATDGYVTRVHERGLGGKVVWLRDRWGHSFYYAHLDSQFVRPNTRVQAGDTLGMVGNTGNARTTPPHLHFGVYQSGPLDPLPFIHVPTKGPPALALDEQLLGRWVRVKAKKVGLYTIPVEVMSALHPLAENTPLRVIGGEGAWYRVEAPDGTQGFIPARHAVDAQVVLSQLTIAKGQPLYRRIASGEVAVDTIAAGTTLPVLGVSGAHALVQTARRRTGWLRNDALERPVRLNQK